MGASSSDDKKALSSNGQGASSTQLTEEEQRIVAQMKARDREVRAHEQAHKAVGGRYAGAISYDFTKGPDGQQYAVGGEVPIDVAPVKGDPRETIAKMEVVIAAALAPVEPSAQDRAVARQAQATKQEALAQLRRDKNEESQPFSVGAGNDDDAGGRSSFSDIINAENAYSAGRLTGAGSQSNFGVNLNESNALASLVA
ncbi:MAG: putative metalloprotease CJM1_0395 family protein [Pseudomonadota bacterium]